MITEEEWDEIEDKMFMEKGENPEAYQVANRIIKNLTKHNSRTIQSATDYIHRYETKYPAVSGTKELIHFIEWLLKEVAD